MNAQKTGKTQKRTPQTYFGLLVNAMAAMGLASMLPMQSEAIIRVLSGEGAGAMAQSQLWTLLLMMGCQGVLAVIFLVALYGYATGGKLPSIRFAAPLVVVMVLARVSIALGGGSWQWPLTRTELYLMIVFIAALASLHPSFRSPKREDES